MSKSPPNPPGIEFDSDTVPRPATEGDSIDAFERSELYNKWQERVVHDDNDFIIAIAASSRTGLSGTGKTTLGVTLAEKLDRSPGGFDAAEQASLDSTEVANDLIPELPQQSAIIFDEAQGTLDSDGVDARRGMASAVIDMARAAAQFRKRQHTLIIIAQSTDWLDSRMMDLIDRLVLIQEKNPHEEYARAVTFDHYRDDLPSNTSAKQYTPAIENLYWEPVPMGSANYQAMDRMKEEAGISDDTEGGKDKELSDEQRKELARTLYEEYGLSQSDVAQHPMIDRSQGWVSQVVNGY
jgi:hypothetical protein